MRKPSCWERIERNWCFWLRRPAARCGSRRAASVRVAGASRAARHGASRLQAAGAAGGESAAIGQRSALGALTVDCQAAPRGIHPVRASAASCTAYQVVCARDAGTSSGRDDRRRWPELVCHYTHMFYIINLSYPFYIRTDATVINNTDCTRILHY